VPSPSTILASGCISAIVIAGLTFLADVSTRAQLDRALQATRVPRSSAAVAPRATRPARLATALDKKRLEATVLMVSRPGDE
jgi:hypothetical protein